MLGLLNRSLQGTAGCTQDVSPSVSQSRSTCSRAAGPELPSRPARHRAPREQRSVPGCARARGTRGRRVPGLRTRGQRVGQNSSVTRSPPATALQTAGAVRRALRAPRFQDQSRRSAPRRGRGQFPDKVVQCGAAARRGPVGAARGPAAGRESAREPRSPPCPPPSTGCARPAKNLAVTGRWTLRAALGEDAGSDTRSHDRTHSDQTRQHHRLPAGHGDSKCVCDGQTTSLPKKSKENGSLPPKKSLKTSSGFRNVKPNSKGPSK